VAINAQTAHMNQNTKKEIMLRVAVKKLHKDAVVPKYAKPGDAGLDLTATSIISNTTFEVTYGTGLALLDSLKYKVGDRIGQLLILPYPQVTLIEETDLSETERGENGFGSSGK